MVVKPVVEETTKTEEVKKESINIKIHLNLHAKVKLDLDAQLSWMVILSLGYLELLPVIMKHVSWAGCNVESVKCGVPGA